MKSLLILLFFFIVITIVYNYSYKKFFTDKVDTKIKSLILPIQLKDKFEYISLEDRFRDMFETPIVNIEYSENILSKKEKSGFSLQRYFTEF